MSTLQQIKLPDITPDIAQYIDAVPIIPSHIQKAIETNRQMIQVLSGLLQRYKSLIAKENKAICETKILMKHKYSSPSPEFTFARQKYLKYFIKYHEGHFKLYNEQYVIINNARSFLEETVKLRSPLVFKEKLFTKNLNTEDTPELKKLSERIIRLQNYASFHQNENVEKKVTSEELHTILGKSAELVEEDINYIPVNEFDERFTTFAYESGLIMKFSQFTEQMKTSFSVLKKNKSPRRMPSISPIPTSDSNQSEVFEELPLFQEETLDPPEVQEEEENFEQLPTFNEQLFQSNIFEMSFDADLTTNKEIAPSDMKIAPPSFFDFDEKEEDVEEESVEDYGMTNKKAFNVNEFNTFVKYFFIALNSDLVNNKNCFSVMKDTALRILFDTYYIDNTFILCGPLCNIKFILACEMALSKTPKDLEISKQLIKEEDQNLEMREYLKKSEHFKEAIENLTMLNFYTNPMDIAYVAYRSIKEIENGLRDVSGKQGQIEMSNDDLFGLLVSCFAENPVASPIAFNRYLDAFCNIRLPSTLEYAAACLKTVVAFLLDQDL